MKQIARKSWIPRKLNELGFVGRGRSRNRPRNDPTLYGGPYPFIQTADIMASDLRVTKYSQTYSEKGLVQSKLWGENTLCMTIAGENTAETAILSFKACFPDSIVGFVADPNKADVRFVKYYLDTIKQQLKNVSKGATQDNLSLDKLLSFDILTPPVTTQHKIAAILSAYDDLIENNTQRIAILEEMAQALYREWFVHFRFPGHEKKRMVESALGMIPEGWEVVKLGKVAIINSSSIKKGYEPFEINYVDINAVSTGRINNIEPILFNVAPGRARRIVKHGDIIWSTVRPNRRSYSIILNPIPNLIVSTGFAVISAQCVPYTYLYQALTTDDFVSYLTNHATGSAYPAVNSGDFQDAQILLPPDSILNEFHSFAVNLFDEKQNLHQKNINLKHTRDLLLPRLISGEVDVEGLDLETGEGMTEAAASIEEDVKKSAEAALAGAQMM